MRVISCRVLHLTIASLAVAPPVQAQVLERVRADVYFGVGTAAVESLTPPALYVFENKPPSDAMLLFEPSLVAAITDRLQVGGSITGALAFNPAAPLAGLPYSRSGIGDARFFVAGVLAGERQFLPSVQLTVHGSAETATLPHLAGPSIAGARVAFYKVVHPRFRIGGSFAMSDDVRKRADWILKPLRATAGMVEVGVSRASMLSIEINHVTGGARIVSGRSVPEIRDLQATIAVTKWNEGRPRVSFMMSGIGLSSDDPFFLVGVRFALFSLRNKEM